MASARAPMVGGVLVERMASSSAPFQRRTGLGEAAAADALVAAAGRRGRVQTVRTRPRTARRLVLTPRSMGHEDVAEEELAAEAALSGRHHGRGAHRVVLIPERRREV